jgi:hypothetical protein
MNGSEGCRVGSVEGLRERVEERVTRAVGIIEGGEVGASAGREVLPSKTGDGVEGEAVGKIVGSRLGR